MWFLHECTAKCLAHSAHVETLRKIINYSWLIVIKILGLFKEEKEGTGSIKVKKREEKRVEQLCRKLVSTEPEKHKGSKKPLGISLSVITGTARRKCPLNSRGETVCLRPVH